MFKKIQNYGLPKNVFEKQVYFTALEAVENDENQLNRFKPFLEGFKEVSLYGWEAISKESCNRSTIELLKHFDLQKIDDISFERNLNKEQKIERVLNSFDTLHNFLKRTAEEVETSEEEKEYELILLAFLLFLEKYYQENYIVYIQTLESEVKSVIEKINNDSDIKNKNQELEKVLKDLEEKAIKDFEELAVGLEKETLDFVKEASEVVAGGAVIITVPEKSKKPKAPASPKEKEKISKEIIDKSKAFWLAEYLSNVIGNLGLFFRQARESFSQEFRSFNDKLEKISINKNNIRLSVLSEYKALFRDLVYESSKTEYYKAILPYSLLKDLDIDGQTKAILYQIKTKEDWNNYAKTTNVVNGFGIHHNSQEFYFPIKTENLELEKEIAKNQRAEFLKS